MRGRTVRPGRLCAAKVGIRPWPTKYFGLNLRKIGQKYLTLVNSSPVGRNKKIPKGTGAPFGIAAYGNGFRAGDYYIMPPMPPPGMAGIAGCSDFFSASTHSVVRNIEAIDAAFSSATRDTFVGSMIPALSISS